MPNPGPCFECRRPIKWPDAPVKGVIVAETTAMPDVNRQFMRSEPLDFHEGCFPYWNPRYELLD
jgi:hypothetical protein